ncbi:glycosyltransferase [Thiomicrorhabdus arctica]|uniref:glycosyltransferase n=1 Tax=Thiomicrorhabdus arctica TaxID=131540 RepID=UPI000361BDB8|nr:glycosyltransferase [Thiomicrorhabdus arctica]
MTKNKLKVLHVVGDPAGGIRKHIHDIFGGLQGEFDLYYVTSQFGDKIFYNELPALMKLLSGYLPLNIVKRPAVTDVFNIFKIMKFIIKNKIDIIHGHGAKGGMYARIAGKLLGCKVVYTPHGGIVHDMFSPLESFIYRGVEKILCKFTDLIIFESKYTQKAFDKRICCKKVKQVTNYNGITPPNLKAKEFHFDNTLKFGVFGMLREEKGPHLAYQVIKELLDEQFNVELHFFGEGEMKDTLIENIHQDNLSGSIIIHGEVDNVNEKMLGMNFIVIPSLFESFGYVAVEAMFLGKPVISSNVGGLVDVLGVDRGFIFEAGEIVSMKTTILAAINSSESDIQQRINKAHAHVTHCFTLQRMCEFLGAEYHTLTHKEIKR